MCGIRNCLFLISTHVRRTNARVEKQLFSVRNKWGNGDGFTIIAFTSQPFGAHLQYINLSGNRLAIDEIDFLYRM